MSTAAFDLREYARTAESPRRDLLRVADYREGVPSAEVAAAIATLARRLDATASWLSTVLVTPTHKDARLTAFLSTWAYERHWVADSLQAIATHAGAPAVHVGPGWSARFAPLYTAVRANVRGDLLPAVHMTERLVDGWFVDALLAGAATVSNDEALTDDLQRLRSVLERQQGFFEEEALRRLGSSAAARRLVRRRLRRRLWPIGGEQEAPGVLPDTIGALLGTGGAWTFALDERVDALPGQAGLGLFARTAANPEGRGLRTIVRALRGRAQGAAAVRRRKDDAD